MLSAEGYLTRKGRSSARKLFIFPAPRQRAGPPRSLSQVQEDRKALRRKNTTDRTRQQRVEVRRSLWGLGDGWRWVWRTKSVTSRKSTRHPIKIGAQFRDLKSFGFYLQERADLFCQLQKALFALVQGPCDGHVEPLSHYLGAALVEEVRGRAVLGVDAVLQRLGQED